MSEPQSNAFGDDETPGFAPGFAPGSAAPATDEWVLEQILDLPPPAPGSAVGPAPDDAGDDVGADSVGAGAWPAPAGAHRGSDDPEATSIVDRQWLAEQIDATDSGGAHRRAADPESTSIVERGWLAEQVQRRPQPQPRERTAGPFAGPPAAAAPPRSGPSWQPPARPAWEAAPRPEPVRPEPPAGPGYDFTAAQGSAASWNYVDGIRSSELVPARRIPPQRGWRKALYRSTFKLVNPGQSPDERYEAELVAKSRSLLRGTYRIAVLGKGGVGKSTVAAALGSVFAELRQDDRVVAVDADTGFGKLAARIDPNASGSYWEIINDPNLATFADMRARVGSNAAGLFVLGGAAETARRRILDPATYRQAMRQLDRHFTLSIIDTGGSTLDSPVTREVLSDVDALIVVSSPWFDGASVAGQTMEWLANGGYTGLLQRTVVVIVDSDGHADKNDLALLAERFGRHGQKVIQLPYDAHLRPGGVIDVAADVSPLTRRRLLELAAECAEHFAATTDRPRGV